VDDFFRSINCLLPLQETYRVGVIVILFGSPAAQLNTPARGIRRAAHAQSSAEQRMRRADRGAMTVFITSLPAN
jgi:hypothetical protein